VKYFFFKFCGLLFIFLFFYYFWHFIFNFVYLYLSTNSRNFYVFIFYGLEILSKNFWKSWNIFLKNVEIWNPIFFINSIVYYLFFYYFFSILLIFFYLFNLSKIVKKILNIFVVLYYTDYRIYQRILENSWIFIKK